MDTTVIVLIVLVLLVLGLVAGGIMLSRRRRSQRLQEHYGPEYERSLQETGDRKAAEARLTEREQRVSKLDIRELRPDERDRFASTWTAIQRGFVDDPARSVHQADEMVVDIMRTRGYPVEDFERRAEDVSVEHPDVVQHYRDARAVRDATVNGSADTEQQRQAVTSYRALVTALLGREPAAAPTATAGPSATASPSDTGGPTDTASPGAPAAPTDTRINGSHRAADIPEEQAR